MLLLLFSRSVMSDSLRLHGLERTRLLCPRDFPGKGSRVGGHFLLQGIFPTPGSNSCLWHGQADSLPLSHLGGPQPAVQGETNALERQGKASPAPRVLYEAGSGVTGSALAVLGRAGADTLTVGRRWVCFQGTGRRLLVPPRAWGHVSKASALCHGGCSRDQT